MDSHKLIADLVNLTREHLKVAKTLEKIELEHLNQRFSEKSWSALECLEHLNRYGAFYIPAIEKAISTTKHKKAAVVFKSGLLGNYFAESMLPKEKLNKMSTFKSMNPLGSELDGEVITRFIAQQEAILQLLTQALEVDIGKTRTPISISRWIKLKLGDTFRVVIYHNKRHIAQAQRALL